MFEVWVPHYFSSNSMHFPLRNALAVSHSFNMLCFYYQVCSFSNFLCDLLYGLCRGTVLNFQIYWNFLVICCCWFEFKEWSSHKIHSMRWQFFDIYQDFFHDLLHRKSCLMPHIPWKECGFYSYLVCSSVNENKIKLANCSNLLYLHWFFFRYSF